MPEKYVHVDGIATFVRHVGPTTLPEQPPDLSRGETVVCMHGAQWNSGLFGALLERLGEAHSPIAFDRPGHARSASLDALGSIAEMSAHARGLLERWGVAKYVLLGASMGGMVALETALAAPEQVRALVLVATAPRVNVADAWLERQRLITEGKARREFGRGDLAQSTPPEILRRAFMEEIKTDPRAVYQNMLVAREFDRENDLGRIRCPTLVLLGEEDKETGAGGELLASRIPNARKVVLPNCGHAQPIVQPEILADHVLAFLAELPR